MKTTGCSCLPPSTSARSPGRLEKSRTQGVFGTGPETHRTSLSPHAAGTGLVVSPAPCRDQLRGPRAACRGRVGSPWWAAWVGLQRDFRAREGPKTRLWGEAGAGASRGWCAGPAVSRSPGLARGRRHCCGAGLSPWQPVLRGRGARTPTARGGASGGGASGGGAGGAQRSEGSEHGAGSAASARRGGSVGRRRVGAGPGARAGERGAGRRRGAAGLSPGLGRRRRGQKGGDAACRERPRSGGRWRSLPVSIGGHRREGLGWARQGARRAGASSLGRGRAGRAGAVVRPFLGQGRGLLPRAPVGMGSLLASSARV